MNALLSKLFLLAVAAFLTGCATAPGPPFTALEPPGAGKGAIYVYRTERFFAAGQAFTVLIDKTKTGEIQNASYLRRELAPGKYTLTIAPGGFAKYFEHPMTVEAGKTTFYDFDFNSGILANAFFIGSEIVQREPGPAVEALKTCKRAE